MPDERDKGRAALWQTKSDNAKAPAYSGQVTAHRDIQEGETLDLALWENDSANPKAPKYRGQMRDKPDNTGGDDGGPPF